MPIAHHHCPLIRFFIVQNLTAMLIILPETLKTMNASLIIKCAPALAAAALFTFQPLLLSASPAPKKPNVLYVFSDMQRAYSMGCYGDKNARTPNLDAFAREGLRLDAAISPTPVCCPHRADLMSGVTYLKHASDAAALHELYRRRGFDGFPCAIVRADLCRPELLCETEVVAVLPPRETEVVAVLPPAATEA